MFTLIAAALTASATFAQWNTGNKPVTIIDCEGQGDYYCSNPIFARTADGKTWMTYKVWEEGGVHQFVQLLNQDGVKQFEGIGIRLNNYPTNTWWSLNGMAVAPDGGVIVSVADARSEKEPTGNEGKYQSFQPSVYKISQEGEFVWGLDGITFPEFQYAPYTDVTVNGEDTYFQFTDITDDKVNAYIMRITKDGEQAYDALKPFYGQLVPSTNGDMLGVSGNTINRYNRDWESVWGESVVYDDQTYGGHEMRPYKTASDGEGGVAIAFVRNMGNFSHNVRIQYIAGDGELGFGLTGIDAYNAEVGDHDYPGITLNPNTKEIMVDWESKVADDSGMAYFPISLGKYSYYGDRFWGELGIETTSKYSASGYAYARVATAALDNGDWLVAYRDLAGWETEMLTIKRIDKDGKDVWKKNYGRNIYFNDTKMFIDGNMGYVFHKGKTGIEALRFSLTDGAVSGIENVEDTKAATPVAFYGIDGKQHDGLQKGINIVKMSDGSSRKIVK